MLLSGDCEIEKTSLESILSTHNESLICDSLFKGIYSIKVSRRELDLIQNKYPEWYPDNKERIPKEVDTYVMHSGALKEIGQVVKKAKIVIPVSLLDLGPEQH
jgi:hypothetical protein